MKKIVVFDCTYGGELFADQLEQEYPIVEVIRVIDWRNSETIQSNPRLARKLARDSHHTSVRWILLSLQIFYSASQA